MDWSKAKSYFIVLFIVLNIFLLGFYIQTEQDSHISAKVLSDTAVILAGEGVQLTCDIPKDTGNAPLLTCQPGDVNPKQVVQTLLGKQVSETIPFDGSKLIAGSKSLAFYGTGHFIYQDTAQFTGTDALNEDMALERVTAFMETLGLKYSQYSIDSINKDGKGRYTVTLVEKFRKRPVYDSSITAVIDRGGIRSFECSSIRLKGVGSGTVEIMPAYQVLVKNVAQEGAREITRIELGFKGMQQQQQDVEFSIGPAWRVSFRDGSVRYYRAIDGEEVK